MFLCNVFLFSFAHLGTLTVQSSTMMYSKKEYWQKTYEVSRQYKVYQWPKMSMIHDWFGGDGQLQMLRTRQMSLGGPLWGRPASQVILPEAAGHSMVLCCMTLDDHPQSSTTWNESSYSWLLSLISGCHSCTLSICHLVCAVSLIKCSHTSSGLVSVSSFFDDEKWCRCWINSAQTSCTDHSNGVRANSADFVTVRDAHWTR